MKKVSKVWAIAKLLTKERNYSTDGERADAASYCRQNIRDNARFKMKRR